MEDDEVSVQQAVHILLEICQILTARLESVEEFALQLEMRIDELNEKEV